MLFDSISLSHYMCWVRLEQYRINEYWLVWIVRISTNESVVVKSGHLDLRLVDSSGLASLECATEGRPKSDLFEYKIRTSECESAQRQSPETVRDQPHFGLGPDLPNLPNDSIETK